MKSLFRTRSFWALLIVWGFVAIVRIRLASMPFERDEGEYAYMGWRMLQGIPPYHEAANMKWPGTYAAYALIMAIFGVSDVGVRIGILLVNAATGVLLWKLTKRWFDSATASWATIFFGIWSLGSATLGLMGHATHFVSFFVVAAVLGLVKAFDSHQSSPSARAIFGCGICFGLAVLMKQHGIFFLLPGLWFVFKKSSPWKTGTARALVLMAGASFPIGLTFLFLWLSGDFGTFWFWTVDYARQYVAVVPTRLILDNLAANMVDFSKDATLWGGAFLGFYLLWRRAHPARGWLTLFYLTSLLTTVPGFYFRPHYFLPVLPFVSILAAHFIRETGAMIRRNGEENHLPLALVGVSMVLVMLFYNRTILFSLSPTAASSALYRGEMFPQTKSIGLQIRQIADANDRIAILGSEPQIAFYAGLPVASKFLYTYNLVEPQPFAAQMQRQMARQIEQAHPRWLVYIDSDRSWIVWPGSDRFIFRWLDKTKRDFTLVQSESNYDPVTKKKTGIELWRRR